MCRLGGIELIVELMTTAHEATDHASLPLANNLLTSFAHSEEAKEWFYMEDADDRESKQGPFTKEYLRQLFLKKEVRFASCEETSCC